MINAPIPQAPLVDLKTGYITREWLRFLSRTSDSINTITNITEVAIGGNPMSASGIDDISEVGNDTTQFLSPQTGALKFTGAVTGSGETDSSTALSLGSFTSLELKTALTDETGSGAAVFATSPTLVTPNLGTPASGTLTNCTGLPISTGVSGLAANVATFLGAPSSSNLISAVTDETGTGALVFATSPALVTPALGTPSSGTLTNCTGLPVSTGVSGLGSNVATFLATPSSANLAAALTDETGSGANVHATSPTLVTPVLGVATATSINFGQDALNYYDEGTFTPGVAFGGGTTGITYSTQNGSFTRIGRNVKFHINVVLSNKGSSTGNATVTGLPFSCNGTHHGVCGVYANSMNAAVTTQVEALAIAGTTTVGVYSYAAGTSTQLTDTGFTNTSQLILSGTYEV